MERFEATLMEANRGGAYVPVPAEVITALGGGARIKVRATFDGIDYRGSVVSMGGGTMIGVLKAIRDQLGKQPGDTMTVTLERDDEERTVTVPDDLAKALDAARVRSHFDNLSYSHRRQYVMWIDEAKRRDTRARRVAQTVERLAAEQP
jgi:hypothetical protein